MPLDDSECKLVVIGNTGAGKSWLSRHISRMLKIPVFHLDQIYWKPGSFTEKQSPEFIEKKIALWQKLETETDNPDIATKNAYMLYEETRAELEHVEKEKSRLLKEIKDCKEFLERHIR